MNGKNRLPKVIAEIGCNHRGDYYTAVNMIKTLAPLGVDVVKFQKREPKECLTEEQYNAPHPVPENSYGKTYGEHRENLELNIEQHKHLKKEVEQHGMIYSTSVWDMTSAKEVVEELNPEMIKLPSAKNQDRDLIDYLYTHYNGEIHISLGMLKRQELVRLVEYISRYNTDNTVIYHCTSDYPVDFENIRLDDIYLLKSNYGLVFKGIGFSGHHLGIAVDIAAMMLGADYIERHFTLDRTWKGTDHAASLEPEGMRKLVRNIHDVYRSLGHKEENEGLLDCELEQRKKFKGQ
jgi:N-acetylneuraminate synthase